MKFGAKVPIDRQQFSEESWYNDFGRSVGIELTLDDFQKVSDEVPFLADLKPSGKYVMEDVHKVCV